MMAVVTKVPIATPGRAYDAWIENGLLRRAGEIIREALPERSHFFIITVPPVRKAWGETLTTALKAAGITHEIMEMPDGERYKTLAAVEELSLRLVSRNAERKSVVIAFGGGVVGDVAGFLASVYMRGVDCVQIPTTLLAQVDAAIGGKTGVNLREGKNLIGTFHQPRAVLIDPGALATLPEREYRSGLYEALKYGVIRRPDIFEFMEKERDKILQRDPTSLEWLIAECVRAKAEVVAADERETDLRRILNFGHSIGHALETETGYKQFLHGEAIAWGMVAAAMIAAAMQKTDSETARRIISAVLAYATLPKVEPRGKRIAHRLHADKKMLDGHLQFILPRSIGNVEIVPDVPERAIVQAVEELRYLSQAG